MFIVKVRVRGESKFVGNDLRFATSAEALDWMRRLAERWSLVEEYYAIEEAS
jgi:hypothetical protein